MQVSNWIARCATWKWIFHSPWRMGSSGCAEPASLYQALHPLCHWVEAAFLRKGMPGPPSTAIQAISGPWGLDEEGRIQLVHLEEKGALVMGPFRGHFVLVVQICHVVSPACSRAHQCLFCDISAWLLIDFWPLWPSDYRCAVQCGWGHLVDPLAPS